MKKKLEAELISIAHRILKLTNKSDLAQLHQETQHLYEKLSVLLFVEKNFADVKPTIGYKEIGEKLETIFDDNASVKKTSSENSVTKIAAEPASNSSSEEKSTDDEIQKPETEKRIETQILDDSSNADNLEIDSEANNEPNEEKPTEDQEIDLVSASEEEEDSIHITAEGTVHPEEIKQQEVSAFSEANPPQNLENDSILADQTIEIGDENSAVVAEELTSTDSIDENNFKPAFELSFDAKEEDNQAVAEENTSNKQIAFDELLGQSYVDPVFVTPEDLRREKATLQSSVDLATSVHGNRDFSTTASRTHTPSSSTHNSPNTLNDRLAKGITIGLNDRIAFMKHLFNNSSEDYNRVLSQLITFSSMDEAQSFIDTMVKPDYNNWDGKDEYAQRFMEIIEKKFS